MDSITIKFNDSKSETFNSKKICFIGANGSGKTRMGVNIEKTYSTNSYRIAAQKNLSFPDSVSPKDKEKSYRELYVGYDYGNNSIDYKWNNRWGSNPETSLLDDYEKLLVVLHTEEYEESVTFKDSYKTDSATSVPHTKLDTIKSIWEEILPHRKLIKKAGKIEATPLTNTMTYNANKMSDGERLIFYFIGQILCAPKNGVIIIDEPENHLNKSIIKKLWDKLEVLREDCFFIYLTHDIDFALTREDSSLIWLKSYNHDQWEYKIIENATSIPKELYLELLGNRKNILFIEGEKDSLDYKLYSKIYSHLSIYPLGSCQKVIESTKAFNNLNSFHNLLAFGIIDTDRRSDQEIENHAENNIYCTPFVEIENIFICKDVIQFMADIEYKNDVDNIFNSVKDKTLNYFNQQKSSQINLFLKNKLENEISTLLSTNNIDSIKINLINASNKIEDFKEEITLQIESIIETKNYEEVLRIFNNKGLGGQSNISNFLGLKNYDTYLTKIFNILKSDTSEGTNLKNIIKSIMNLNL